MVQQEKGGGKVTVAVAQLCSTPDVDANLSVCRSLVDEAAGRGADWVMFPENAPFLGPEREKFAVAEGLDGPVVGAFVAMARERSVGILLGSTVEVSQHPGMTRNTSVLIDASGQVSAVYRKVHLFDVELPGGQTLFESETVEPGDALVCAPLGGLTLGMTVCYDLRFAEMYRKLAQAGAQVVCVPAAFTERTGRDHWEVLLRARAIENQCYVVAPNQWGHHCPGRDSYGRSMIIDPWGTVVAQVPDGVGVALAVLDGEKVAQVRRRMPCMSHARFLES